MHFDNQVIPQDHYMSIADACRLLGMERAQIHGLQRLKQLDWDVLAGRTLLYRQSVLAYKDRMDNASKPHNPYSKEVANARQPNP